MKPLTLHAHVVGDDSKPTILLLHGLMGSWRTWLPVMLELEKDYRIIAIDLLGFGESPKPRANNYALKDHLQAIQDSLRQHDVRKVDMVVGFSLGGVLATHLIKKRYVKTDRLLLVSAPLYANKGDMARRIKRSPTPAIFRRGPIARAMTLVRRRSPHVTRFVAKMTHPKIPSLVVDDTRKVPYYAYARTRKRVLEKETVVRKLPRVKRLAILVGSHDMYADVSYLAQLSRDRKGMLEVLPNIGHSIPFMAPQQIVMMIRTLFAADVHIDDIKLSRDL